PLAVPNPDPLANAIGRHTGPDLFDHTCTVALGDDPRRKHRPGSTSRLDVVWIDARSLERDADLAGPRLGSRHLPYSKHLPRPTRPLIPSRSHRAVTSRSLGQSVGHQHRSPSSTKHYVPW